jgi:large subunit ribosomal protein L28
MALRAPLWRHCRLNCPFQSPSRSFATTSTLYAKSSKKQLADDHANIPTYPYGPARWYKQSNFGLYGGQRIRFGNNVSERTETKTRRKWRPNIQHKRLWSVALARFIQIKVSTRVLRTIDKCGGLDEYVVGEKSARVKELGMKGWELRWRVMQTPWWKSKARAEREGLGLVELERLEMKRNHRVGGEELVGRDGAVVSEEVLAEQVRAYDEEAAKEEVMLSEESITGEARSDGFMVEQPPPPKIPTEAEARV